MSQNQKQDSQERIEKNKKDNQVAPQKKPKEIGGPSGPEPTRYNDWERGGRCIDF